MNPLVRSLERLPLNTKLLLAIGVGFVITLVVGLASLAAISTLSESTQRGYEQELLGVSHFLEAKADLTMMGRDLRWMAMSSTARDRTAGRKSVVDAEASVRLHVEEGRKRIFHDDGKKALRIFDEVFPVYSKSVAHVIRLLERNDSLANGDAMRFLGGADYDTAIITADRALDAIVKSMKDAARLSARQSEELADRSQKFVTLLLVLGLAASLGFGLLVGRSIRRPMDDLRHCVEDLAAGRLDIAVPHTDHRNEVGAMANSLCVLQQGARTQVGFGWVKTQSAELLAALQGIDDMADFARRLMTRLTPLLSAQVGVFYYRAPETTCYCLLASHAYLHRKGLKQQFAVGEGLIGQCVVERAPITVSALDPDYIQIASGLGQTPPRFLLAAPLITASGDIPAVIEVASLARFGEREQALLDEVLPMIALSINVLERNSRTRELLDESKRQQVILSEQAQKMELLGRRDGLAQPTIGKDI